MNFTFPANTSSPGFDVDIPVRNFTPEASFATMQLVQESLFIYSKTPYSSTLLPHRVFGWHRQPFPICCGLDIVTELYNYGHTNLHKIETMEKWWKWMEGLIPRVKPSIGIVPRIINEKNVMQEDPYYAWYSSKGVQWGDPIKNFNYPNHVLIPYLFFPHKGIEQILKPKFGLFTQ